MKKIAKTLLLSATFVGAAHGQTNSSSVQLYGIVDSGVEHVTNVGPGHADITRVPSLSGGQLPSRIGFRGSEDLGNGIKAIFTLESGFGVDTGQSLQGGRLFGRQAFVGLSGDWGTLTVGRHWSMVFYSMLDADVIGPASLSLAALDSYIPNARTDNSILYRGTFKGFTIGATYSTGRDTLQPANCAGETSSSTCHAWSAMLKYDTPMWGAAVAYDRLNGGPAGTFIGQPAGTVASANNMDSRTIVNGYMKLGETKVGGGWIQRKLKAKPTERSTDIYFLGLSHPFTSEFSVDGQIVNLRDERPNSNARMLVIRTNYALSKRTSVYALAGRVLNDSNAAYSISGGEIASSAPTAGGGQTGTMLGIRHAF
jgi:predicted porin